MDMPTTMRPLGISRGHDRCQFRWIYSKVPFFWGVESAGNSGLSMFIWFQNALCWVPNLVVWNGSDSTYGLLDGFPWFPVVFPKLQITLERSQFTDFQVGLQVCPSGTTYTWSIGCPTDPQAGHRKKWDRPGIEAAGWSHTARCSICSERWPVSRWAKPESLPLGFQV